MTLRLHVVGGVGSFGMNCLVVEDAGSGDCVVVDAGVGFPRDLPSARERLAPDPTFMRAFAGRVRAYVCTHGHEDHIGALGLLHSEAPAPVYGRPTTLHLIRHRCEDSRWVTPDLHVLDAGADLQLGSIRLTALHVSHSIPDSLCLVMEVGGLRLVHSGDFRVDADPLLGPPTDMSGLSAVGALGVDILLADSTGATHTGHNPGERAVLEPLGRVFNETPGRMFITTFASHIQRVHAVAELCAQHGRKLALWGRGMVNHTRIAQKLATLPGLEAVSMHTSDAPGALPARTAVLLSGCQGEDHSAFWRLAHADGRMPPVRFGDTVIHSARAVPGSEGRLANLFDLLAVRGARVVDGNAGVHVSGHAYREDLRALVKALQPRVVMPIHGGARHLVALAELCRTDGYTDECSPVFSNGDVVELEPGGVPRVVDHLPVPHVMLDDDGGTCFADPVIAERRELMGGAVMISAAWSGATGELLGRPRISARGLAGAARQLLLTEGAHEAAVSVYALPEDLRADPEAVESALRKGVRRVLRRLGNPALSLVAHLHDADGEPVTAPDTRAEDRDGQDAP